MATIACIHGAGGRGADWSLVAEELRARGHHVIPVDLPCDDDGAGLAAYADAVVDAVRAHERPADGLVVVAQSLAGFTAPLVCDRLPVDLLVLVTAMVPQPGETGNEWWEHTGYAAARAAQDPTGGWSEEELFTHDVPPEVLAASEPPRDQSGTPMDEPWPLERWPDVPTRFLLCTDDRFFPPEWMRGVVRQRLGIEPDEVPGGHCAYLSRPVELAAAIDRCWTEERGRAGG